MTKTALRNVRVFDGHKILEPSTVVIDGALIGDPSDTAGAVDLDCRGALLLPGLVDAHIHLDGPENLFQLRAYGVTTAMDMGAWPVELVTSLREKGKQEGLTTILSAGIPASSPGSRHSHIHGFPATGLLSGPEAVDEFVANRISDGSDYIKIISDVPGPTQATMNALVDTARARGKKTVAHASALKPIQMAIEAGVDALTHVPLDQVIDDESVARMVAQHIACIPTLTMMDGIARNMKLPPRCYESASLSVKKMYEAGVCILVGTDANAAKGVPANVPHGLSIHTEMDLMVQAGMSVVDTLRAATVLPTEWFGLPRKGSIEVGKTADLVLVEGDVLGDITRTKDVKRVWCAGVEYVPET